jgi:hypothetical protein
VSSRTDHASNWTHNEIEGLRSVDNSNYSDFLMIWRLSLVLVNAILIDLRSSIVGGRQFKEILEL